MSTCFSGINEKKQQQQNKTKNKNEQSNKKVAELLTVNTEKTHFTYERISENYVLFLAPAQLPQNIKTVFSFGGYFHTAKESDSMHPE